MNEVNGKWMRWICTVANAEAYIKIYISTSINA